MLKTNQTFKDDIDGRSTIEREIGNPRFESGFQFRPSHLIGSPASGRRPANAVQPSASPMADSCFPESEPDSPSHMR
jgi:hypothetical protein